MALVAKRAFRYAGRMLAAGEVFWPRGRNDARLLTALGKAEVVDDTQAAKRRVRAPKVRDPEPAPLVLEPEVQEVVDEVRSRYYGRRDMESE